jgi:hypothetical protein
MTMLSLIYCVLIIYVLGGLCLNYAWRHEKHSLKMRIFIMLVYPFAFIHNLFRYIKNQYR